MSEYTSNICYSERYDDGVYEYRHVILPHEVYMQAPRNRYMSEEEWRQLGVKQSKGWEHFLIHKSEPHVLIFRRPLQTAAVKNDN